MIPLKKKQQESYKIQTAINTLIIKTIKKLGNIVIIQENTEVLHLAHAN